MMLTSILSKQGIDLRSKRASLLLIHSAEQILKAIELAVSTIPNEVFPRNPNTILISLAKRLVVSEDQTIGMDQAVKAAYLPPAILSESDQRRGIEVLRHLREAGVVTVRDQRVRFVHPVLAPLLVAQAYFEPMQAVWRSIWFADDDPDNVYAQLRLAKVVLRSAEDRSGELVRLRNDRPHLAAYYLAHDPRSSTAEIGRIFWHLIHRIDSDTKVTEVERTIDSITAFGDRCHSVCRTTLRQEKWLAVQLFVLLRCLARVGSTEDLPLIEAIVKDAAAPFSKEKDLEEELRELDRIVASFKKDYYASRIGQVGKLAGRTVLTLGAGYLRAMDSTGRVPGATRLDQAKSVHESKPGGVTSVESDPFLEAEIERRRRLRALRKRLPKVRDSNKRWAPKVGAAARAAMTEIMARNKKGPHLKA